MENIAFLKIAPKKTVLDKKVVLRRIQGMLEEHRREIEKQSNNDYRN